MLLATFSCTSLPILFSESEKEAVQEDMNLKKMKK